MKIRYKRPDKKNAISIIKAAKIDMDFTLRMKPNKESANTIIRNVYECFRKLGDALLVLRGIESIDHTMPIKELMKLRVSTTRPINLVDNLRRLRHNINYYGYLPSVREVEDVLSLAESCFYPLYKAVLDECKKD